MKIFRSNTKVLNALNPWYVHCSPKMPTTMEYINQYLKNENVYLAQSQSLSETLRFNMINIFILKYWLIYTVVVGISGSLHDVVRLMRQRISLFIT